MAKSYSIEFRAESLDGTTPSPTFSFPATLSTQGPLDAQQIYVRTVELLGLVNVNAGGVGPSFANRFIKDLVIESPNFPAAGSNVQVVVFNPLSPATPVVVEDVVTIPATSNGVYVPGCIVVPQGGALRLSNVLSGDPEDPIVVRFRLWIPETGEEYAAQMKACCCLGSDAEPLPAQPVLYDCEAPQFVSITPDTAPDDPGIINVTVVVSGTLPENIGVFMPASPFDPLTLGNIDPAIAVDNIVRVNDTTFTFQLDPANIVDSYSLLITDLDTPSCFSVEDDAFTITAG